MIKGQGTKLYFLPGLLIGMKNSQQLNIEIEHLTSYIVHLIFKWKQLLYCGQLDGQIAMQIYYSTIAL